jgi:hypothetical protein
MIVELLNRFEPEPEGLLREISKHIDDEVLEWISTSDYGSRANEHMVALRQVRDSGTFPEEMYWCPMEVLELIRWSEPEDPEWKPGRTGEFGHWMRAFSCAALLRATREPWNYGDGLGTDSTLVQLILSLHALPVDFTPQAVKFLAWLLLNLEPEGKDKQVCAYGIGLLWFALRLTPPVADGTLISLTKWIVRRTEELYGSYSLGGLPGLQEMVIECQKRESWERLGIAFSDFDLSGRSFALKRLVTTFGEQLAG